MPWRSRMLFAYHGGSKSSPAIDVIAKHACDKVHLSCASREPSLIGVKIAHRAGEIIRDQGQSHQARHPLEYMLRIMRDEAAASTRRDDMAKAARRPSAGPMARLSSVEHTGDTEEFRKRCIDMTDDELAAIASGATLHVVK